MRKVNIYSIFDRNGGIIKIVDGYEALIGALDSIMPDRIKEQDPSQDEDSTIYMMYDAKGLPGVIVFKFISYYPETRERNILRGLSKKIKKLNKVESKTYVNNYAILLAKTIWEFTSYSTIYNEIMNNYITNTMTDFSFKIIDNDGEPDVDVISTESIWYFE